MNKFLTDKKPIRIVASNHDEWLSLRKGIGSSDIATLMGCNKYSTPYQLWLEKKGLSPKKEENIYMKMGHLLEPVVASLWEEETGNRIKDGTEEEYLYVHPEYDFLRASPDREFTLAGGSDGILECKTTQQVVTPEELPEYWFCQVQYQMGIAQIDYCNVAWLTQGHQFGYVEILFNQELYQQMVEVAKGFWNKNILGNEEPVLATANDVVLKYRNSTSKSIEASSRLLDLYSQLKEVQQQEKELETRKSIIADEIKLAMLDSDRLVYQGDTLITWKSNKDSTDFDKKRFKIEHPDIYDKYLVTKKGSRPFVIK